MKEKIFNIGKTLLWAVIIGFCMIAFFIAAAITTGLVSRHAFHKQLNIALQDGYTFYVDGVETAPQDIPEGFCSMNNTIIKKEDCEVHVATVPRERREKMKYDAVYIDGKKVDRDHISPELYPAEQIRYDAKTKTIYIATA